MSIGTATLPIASVTGSPLKVLPAWENLLISLIVMLIGGCDGKLIVAVAV